MSVYFVVVQLLSLVQLFDPMDGSLPGSSVHEILQARILEWVAVSFSGGSSQIRDQTCISCLAGGFFTTGMCVCVFNRTQCSGEDWFSRGAVRKRAQGLGDGAMPCPSSRPDSTSQ